MYVCIVNIISATINEKKNSLIVLFVCGIPIWQRLKLNVCSMTFYSLRKQLMLENLLSVISFLFPLSTREKLVIVCRWSET